MITTPNEQKQSGCLPKKGSVSFFLHPEPLRIQGRGLVFICVVSLLCSQVNGCPTDRGDEARPQASSGMAVSNAAINVPAIPTVPDTQPSLAHKTHNITGSINGKTVGEGTGDPESMSGMDSAREAERIDGAFGFEFGQRFTGKKEAVVPEEVKSFWNDYLKGKWWYQVQPPTPNKLFIEYYLLLTPKSSSIVGILAVRDYAQVWSEQSGMEPDLSACLQDRDAVFAILKRKYYSKSPTQKVESQLRHRGGEPMGIFSIEQHVGEEMKKRWVSVHCNGVVDRRPTSFGRHLRLTVVYGDLEMNALHNREVAEYMLESNDPSGF